VDLVIMDVSLVNTRLHGRPVTGVELCRALKDDPRTAALPIMLATAHAMRGDAESFLQRSGADGYVAKPILDHNEFVARVLALMPEAA
jgi:two-component system cell cycle response regulator DivK